MTDVIVKAAMVPGFPHLLADGVPGWEALGQATRRVGEELAILQPDAVVMISTQWFTVLGQQFQADPNPSGRHVDENWYDFPFGTFEYRLRVDVPLVRAWAEQAERDGFQARLTHYAHFPVDTGTLTALRLLDPEGRLPVTLMSVNLYASDDHMGRLGAAARRAAEGLGRRVAVVAVSGLSSGWINRWISPGEDRFEDPSHDRWNRRVLGLIGDGRAEELLALREEYAAAARVDNQFRAFPFLVGTGALSGPGVVRGYGPVWGAGAAVITWGDSPHG